MVIFQYNLYIFGIHFWTIFYPKPCYNEPCYKEVEVYVKFYSGEILVGIYFAICHPSLRKINITNKDFRSHICWMDLFIWQLEISSCLPILFKICLPGIF